MSTLKTFLIRAQNRTRRAIGLDRLPAKLADYQLEESEARGRPEAGDGDLARIFFANKGRLVHKWLHYFPIYERYLARYRGIGFKMMEIGVFKGGSIAMWRDYFGEQAMLFGVDIDPACARYVDPPNQVRIGSQDDPAFLRRVVGEMGGLDVVLDDGSHVAEHQRASFEALFPLLADGGLYIIEDLHTAYWVADYNGGYGRKGTAIEDAKALIDDMHHWWHGRQFNAVSKGDIAGIHFHDSIVVIEKRAAQRPIHTKIGVEPDAA